MASRATSLNGYYVAPAENAGNTLSRGSAAGPPAACEGHNTDMPFKSRAQRRKFAELLVKGEISPATFEEWNRETGRKKLPERVKPKARKTARKKARRKK